ncbi:hypothetical protein [Brevibacillus brevis]|uniref:Uncharacterized protein n=1 Tax=Brevibacillus brevis TaxID=1393 RepID=A0ABY9TFW9_BREBE|nr:hypothetical protein [Brevibacillus brevis]WNC17878.1 hypothetical protein RGB73_30380 [Brevibacillus brevis]
MSWEAQFIGRCNACGDHCRVMEVDAETSLCADCFYREQLANDVSSYVRAAIRSLLKAGDLSRRLNNPTLQKEIEKAIQICGLPLRALGE